MAKSIFQQSPMDAAIDDIAASASLAPSIPDFPDLKLPEPDPVVEPTPPVAASSPRPRRGEAVKLPPAMKPVFEAAAVRHKVPVNVLMALAEQESRYNPAAVGVPTQWGRAKGVMQYLDSTARGLGINPYDSDAAIDAAAKQLRERLNKGYSMADAVREHFAGPDRSKWGAKTAAYGVEVLGRAARLKDMLAPEYEKRAPSGPWYSPGAKPSGKIAPIPADAIAGVTGKAATPARPDIGLAATVENPNSLPAIVARRDSEAQRLPGEANLRPTSRPDIATQFKQDVRRGVDSVGNLGVGIAALGADLVGADDTADDLLARYIRNEEESAAKNPAVIGTYKNIEDLGDAGRYAVEAIGENLPMFLPSLLSGGVGALAARKVAERGVASFVEAQVAKGVARDIAEKQAAQLVARRATAGAAAGAAASSVGMESGSIYGDTFAETGEKAPGLALAFGVPAGLLDAIEPVYALRRVAGPAVDELAGGIIKRLGREVGAQFLLEAGTEGLQTMLEEAPKSISTGQPYWTGDLLDRVIDAGLKGGIGGGVMGAGTAALSGPGRAAPADPEINRAAIEALSPAGDDAIRPQPRDIPPAPEPTPTAALAEVAPPAQAAEAEVTEPAPAPTGPLGRALARAPMPEPIADAADVPLPLDADAPPQPMTLVTQGVEYPVQFIGRTDDAMWVKTDGGEELQIPHADIDAGLVQLMQPGEAAAPSSGKPAEQPALDAPAPEDAKAVAAASDSAAPAPAAPSTPAAPAEDVKIDAPAAVEHVDPETGEIRIVAPTAKQPKKAARPAAEADAPLPESETDLRLRLKYLRDQARTNNGWSKPLLAEKKRVEAAIDGLKGRTTAQAEDLRELGKMGAGMAEALIDMYHEQASAGSVKNKAGVTDPILQVAKQVRARRGVELARAEVEEIARAVDGVKATGEERQASLRQIVDQFAPANNAGAIEQAAAEAAMSPLNDRPEPTDAQKEAGNYKKGHASIDGLNVSIENPAGTSRRPEWPPLKHSYGYVKRSEGADGDHVDVFLGPKANDAANPVFIVDQVNKDGSFDEHKVMVGFSDIGAARRGYLANYEKGWTGLGDITEMPFAEFKEWVKDAARTNAPAGKRLASSTNAEPEAQPTLNSAEPPVVPPPPAISPAAPPSRKLERVAKRETDKHHPNAYVRAGERWTVSENIDYLTKGETYVIRSTSNKSAYFQREGTDSGTSLQNYMIERGLREGIMVRTGDETPLGKPKKAVAPKRYEHQGYADPRENDLGRTVVNALNGATPREQAIQAISDAVAKGDVQMGFAAVQLQRLDADRAQVDEIMRRIPADPETETDVERRRRERAERREKVSPAPTPTAADSADTFSRVWKSAEFKKAAKALGAPHRESPVAADMVRGWIDGRARDRAALDREMAGAIARDTAAVEKPTGWNPSQSYLEGFYAAVTGAPREIRTVETQERLGAARAHEELKALLSVSPEQAVSPANSKPQADDAFANNKLFTADKVEAARARIREKMNRINSGIDPELLTDGMMIAGAYIEAGLRKFADYAKAMQDDFGPRIRPYLLSFWEGARNWPGLDTTGMSSAEESRAQHAAMIAEGLPVEETVALGTEIARPKPKKAKAAAKPAGARTLRDDWGVDNIDGWTPIDGGANQERDYGLKGGLKDAFLADATAYLRAVAAELRVLGFEPHVNAKGKEENPVARNVSGVATSGEVTLTMRGRNGALVHAKVGGTSLRGAVPTTKAGVSIMYRVSRKDGDKYATAGVNRWAPTDLSAIDLADAIEWEANLGKPELTRDHVREPEPDRSSADRGGVSPVQGGRDGAPQQGDAPAHSGDLGTGQPADVGQPASAVSDGKDGVRGAGTDVAKAGRAAEGGVSGDGRARASRTRRADAGAGKSAAGELDLFADVGEKVEAKSVVPEKIEPALPDTPSPARSGPGNFLIANPLDIVGGGPVARFDRNRLAIETFSAIRDDGRAATSEEQRILAGYTGWGSFGQELFQGTWDRSMPKDGWAERDRWLRDHLGRDEWESAQRSITNAHYTDPPTVMAMWAMMERMGFKGGRVLEPSMGIGNFFGMMPAAIAGRSQLSGIELDRLTGGMAQLLYPDANVRVMPYQESRTPDGFYDVVIGNWPFENTVIADRRYDKLSPYLHDYFFLKAVDQVRAGGLVMGITSSGTMDKKATGIRRELAKKAELVASFRLPSGAFAEYAGTKVVTDIVILRKRAEPISLADGEGWINSVAYQTPNGEVFLNEYYVANPSHVIGRIDFGHGTTRGQPGLIVHRPDDMQEQLQRIVSTAPEGAYKQESRAQHISYVANHTADREGALTITKDGLFIVRGEHLAPAADVMAYAVKDEKKTADRVEQLGRLIEMRRAYAALIEAERAGDATAERKALKTSYAAFTDKHGTLNDSFGLSYLRKIDDPFYPALAALEIDGKPAAIMSRSTTRGAATIANPTIADAFVLARNSAVNPALSDIAAIAGVTPEEAKAELIGSGAVFELPSGDIQPSDMYLAGNVREKMRQAKAAVAEGLTHLQRNVDALAEVVPADVPYFKIETQLGATWISPAIYEQFVGHMLGMSDSKGVEARYNAGRWTIRIDDRAKARPESRTGFGTGEYGFQRLVNAAFGNQTVTIRRTDSEGKKYVDNAATEEVNGKIAEMRTKFADWLWSDPERRVAVEAEYNEVRNAFATPKFDGSFLRFEGMALSLGNGPFDLRQHQADAIWRALVSRRSLNAHEVGTGKTFTMGGIAVESRRYGIARKPLILAHNANSKTVGAEIQQMYPAAKVLYIDNLSPDTIDVKMRQIANDDWDAIVVPHSLIDRFAFREETLMDMAREDIAALEEEAYAAAGDDGVTIKDEMWDDPEELKKLRSPTAKELVKMRQRIIESIRKQSHRASREGAIPFEELGVDMLMVDEAHEFKKPPISTRMKMKGLNTQTSDRSIALSFLTRYVRAQNAGGNVHLFTGTPITNTLTEVFHMMRYIMQEEMQAAGVDQWDGWFGSFAREVMDVEQNAAAEYEAVTRLAGFINVPELRRMIGQYMDVVFAEDMPEMKPRRTASGKTMADDLTEMERAELLNGRTENAKDRPYKKVINVTSDLTPQQKVIFEELRGYARRWRAMTGKERRDAMAAGAPESPIITEGLAAKASFDVRLYDGEALAGQEGKAFDDPGSKASRVVENVKEIYDSNPLATQVIFAEQGSATRVTRSLGKDDDGAKKTRSFPTFSTIRDIIERLVAAGIPRDQIALVDGATSKEKRKEIALKMNAAKIRVVIGSTATLGVGVNMQKNLRAMHHMDAPWMPGDLEQRNGRGQRQGNQWNTVLEYRYLTDRLDGRRWQVLAIKQRFITAFLKADDSARTIEGEAAADEQSDILQSFAEAAGDPRILIREKLRKQLDSVQRRERLHGQGIANALSQARRLTKQVEESRGELAAIEAAGTVDKARAIIETNAGKGFSIVINGATIEKRKDADDAILAWAAHNMRMGDEPKKIGVFGGHDLMLAWPSNEERPILRMTLDGQKFAGGSVQGLENSLRRFGPDIERGRAEIEEMEASIKRAEAVSQEPFHMAADLARFEKALDDLELDIRVNPVPPPAWLRTGAPIDTDAYWGGKPFTVSGHRWTADGWFVLANDDKGAISIPYMEAKDAQGINLYEERPFEAPEVVEAKKDGAAPAAPQDEPAAHSIGGLGGGGFESSAGLRAHLAETPLGQPIEQLIDAGKIVVHDTDASLRGPSVAPSADERYSVRASEEEREFLIGDAVASMRGDEVPNVGGTSATVRWATDYFAEKVGGSVVHPEIGSVRLDRRGVKDTLSHGYGPAKVQALYLLPEVLPQAHVLAVESRRDNEVGYVLAAPVEIGGKHHILTAVVKRNANRTGLYVHEAFLTEKFREAIITAVPSGDGRSRGQPGTIANIVAQVLNFNRDAESRADGIQGMTTRDGTIHLVADRLTSRTALPVLLHEMFHAGVQPLVGEAAWSGLMNRLAVLYRAAAARESGGERGNSPFWRAALERVELAQPPIGQEVEEFGAYAIEHRAQAPAGVGALVDRVIGAVKAWALRRFGRQLGAVTPAQLQSLAIAALRSQTIGPRADAAGLSFLSRIVPPVEQVDAASAGLLHNIMTKAMDGNMSVLGVVPLRPLLTEMGARIPAAREYLALKQAMDATRDKWHARADDVAQPWLKFRVLHRAENAKLMDLMHEATLTGADPSKDFHSSLTKLDRQILSEGPGTEAYDAAWAKAQRDKERKAAHGRLVPLYQALPAEAQRLFTAVRDSYRALGDAFEQALLDNLSNALDIKLKQAQRAFDVEVMRIADSGMTKEAADKAVSAAERELLKAKQLQGWAKGARMTRLRHFFETNNLSGPYFPLARFGNFFVTVRDADDQVISFSRFESPKAQQAFAKEMQAAGHDVTMGVLEDGGALKAQVDARFVADVENILEGADVSDTVRDAVWQRWLETMPDMSVRTSRIHRKGRAGFSTDALRAFGNHMFHGSHQLARLKYALDMDETIALARDQAKTMPDPVRAGLLVNELARRHQFTMNPTGGPLAQVVTSAAFTYFLAASPAAALVNTSQTAVLGVPILAAYDGRAGLGAARAAKELTRALRDFATGRGHAGEGKRLTDDERKAMEAAYETGLIERTQSHDLAGVGETGVAYSPVRTKVMAAISWAFHHAERMNREVTFLAAYRMARGKNEPHEYAIDRAADLTWKIHFDYQNTSRPRVMQNDTAKVLFVFRNFNVNMLWRLFRDTHQAVKGGTKQERREALIQLAGTTGMMMVSAGIRGTWMYGIALMLAGLFFGDDAEDKFTNAMQEAIGTRLTGMALNGVPGDVLGIDLSNRIGMPDLWFRSPDRELEGQQEFDYWALQVLGAGVGQLRNLWTGASMIANGNVYRGVETLMPKFAKDLMRAQRYMSEGARTLKGDPIMENMPPSAAIKQALGFTPAGLSERYDLNRAMKNKEQRILDERSLILADYDGAVRAGAETDSIGERIERFNEAYPGYPITAKTVRQSIRARDRARARNMGGVNINPKLAAQLVEESPQAMYAEE